jgi:Tol biopolymer transport system component
MTGWMWRLTVISLLSGSVVAGEPLRLTHDGRLKFTPVFCDDGASLVYVDFEKPTLFRLKRLRLDTGVAEPLHPEAATAQFEPAWSRRTSVYAYAHTRGTLSISVIIRRPDGQQAEILPGGGFDGLRSPAVSPDGTRVLYCHAEKGRWQIFPVAADGTGSRALTDSQGINNWPDFSPDGERIVFASSRAGDYEIHVMQSDGTNVRRLTDSPLQDIRPRFSPDGNQIAFTSHRDGNPELYLMKADGSDVRRVTIHEERDDYPAWHPTGAQLVAVCERDGEHDLYLLDVP